MKKRPFIDNLPFRLLGPIISGLIVYVLILLLNNELDQVIENFINQELLLCISLSYIISEVNRLILKYHGKVESRLMLPWSVLLIGLIAALSSVVVIFILVYFYFKLIIGYAPNIDEVRIFIILYLGLSIALISIYLSNYFIEVAYNNKLSIAKSIELQSKENFLRLTRGINPELLFESLESVINYSDSDKEIADEIIDLISIIYRYTLSKNNVEIVRLSEELPILTALATLINYLPYRKVSIDSRLTENYNIVPGTLLFIVEQIVKTTIAIKDKVANILIQNGSDSIDISYNLQEKLTSKFDQSTLQGFETSYNIYSGKGIKIIDQEGRRTIQIPKLHLV